MYSETPRRGSVLLTGTGMPPIATRASDNAASESPSAAQEITTAAQTCADIYVPAVTVPVGIVIVLSAG